MKNALLTAKIFTRGLITAGFAYSAIQSGKTLFSHIKTAIS